MGRLSEALPCNSVPWNGMWYSLGSVAKCVWVLSASCHYGKSVLGFLCTFGRWLVTKFIKDEQFCGKWPKPESISYCYRKADSTVRCVNRITESKTGVTRLFCLAESSQEGSRYFHQAGDIECLCSTGEGLAGSSLWLQPLRNAKDQWQFGGLRQRQREWELPVATMPCLLKQLLLLWTINNMEKQNKVHQKKEVAFWRESLSVLKLIWSKQLFLNKDF